MGKEGGGGGPDKIFVRCKMSGPAHQGIYYIFSPVGAVSIPPPRTKKKKPGVATQGRTSNRSLFGGIKLNWHFNRGKY